MTEHISDMPPRTTRKVDRATRRNIRSFLLILLVGVLLIAVNAGVESIPDRLTRRDVTISRITDISDRTVKLLDALDREVTLYWLCEDGNTDVQMNMFLSRYTDGSEKITLKVLDPLTDPDFASDYAQGVLGNYSLIVQSDLRNTVVDSNDLYVFTNDYADQLYGGRTEMSYSDMSAFYTQFYNAYGCAPEDSSTHLYFKGEVLLTSAIDYVVAPTVPHGYLLTGHGCDTLPAKLTDMLDAYDAVPTPLDLRATGAVPEDANCVIIFDPQTDLDTQEADLLGDYLDDGGSVMLVTNPVAVPNCPLVASLLGERFGLSAQPGLVIDNKEGHFAYNSVYQLIPEANTAHEIAYMLNANSVTARIPEAHGIAIAETLPAGVTAVPILSTSAEGNRLSTDGAQTALGKNGQIHVAVDAARKITLPDGTVGEANLVWFGSAEAFADSVAETVNYGNDYYFLFPLIDMSDPFVSSYSGIASTELISGIMTDLDMGAAVVWMLITVAAIPAGLLIAGYVVWRRRKG